MSDQRPDGEYGWLYGEDKPTRPVPREAASDLPPPNLPPPGRRVGDEPPSGPKKPRKRHNGRRIFGILVLAWVVFLVAVPWWAWGQIEKVDVSPASGRPAEQPGTTYLLVGSDSRAGLSFQQRKQLTTGNEVGKRTDTIMLLHTGHWKPVLLSIPRDSLVPIPGHGTTKINAAFAYGGAKLLIRTIEQDTGVRIDHYVEIGFGGFVNAVDAVHGITVCPTRRLVDPKAGLKINAGCQHVDGITALAYARSRHSDPALGDITRARHQREVVSAIGDRVKSPWSVLNPWRYSSLIDAATTSLKVSDGTGVLDMAHFARAMTNVNGKSGLTCSMPIRDLAVHWDRDRALALLRLIKTDKTSDIPKSLCLPTGLKS